MNISEVEQQLCRACPYYQLPGVNYPENGKTQNSDQFFSTQNYFSKFLEQLVELF